VSFFPSTFFLTSRISFSSIFSESFSISSSEISPFIRVGFSPDTSSINSSPVSLNILSFNSAAKL